MAKHRFSPPLAGIDSLAFRLLSIHQFAHNRALQKRFFFETRDLRKTGSADCLPASTEPAVAASRPVPIAKARFCTRDRLHAGACEMRLSAQERERLDDV